MKILFTRHEALEMNVLLIEGLRAARRLRAATLESIDNLSPEQRLLNLARLTLSRGEIELSPELRQQLTYLLDLGWRTLGDMRLDDTPERDGALYSALRTKFA